MTLNEICEMTTNPTMLNALHACRENHPWYKMAIEDGRNPWQAAWFLAKQRPSYELSCAVVDWLDEQACEFETAKGRERDWELNFNHLNRIPAHLET